MNQHSTAIFLTPSHPDTRQALLVIPTPFFPRVRMRRSPRRAVLLPETRTTRGLAKRAQSNVRFETNMLGKLGKLCVGVGKEKRRVTMCKDATLQKICSVGTMVGRARACCVLAALSQAGRGLRQRRCIYLHAVRPHSCTQWSELSQADASASLCRSWPTSPRSP